MMILITLGAHGVSSQSRNLKHKAKKRCKPIKANRSELYTSIATVGDCKSLCDDNLTCLGYDYSASSKKCHILFYWPNRKSTSDSSQYCGMADASYFEPLISPSQSSEVITIPLPPPPAFLTKPPKINCPHKQSGLLDWQDASTWGGVTPTSGDDVTLPPNSKVIIKTKLTDTYGLITIPSTSELIFHEVKKVGVSIEATGFNVQGKLTAGSDSCLLNSPIEITLHGTRPSDATTNIQPPTYKGISIDGDKAELNLHGQQFYRSWTRLAKTVEVGDKYILVQEKVNWRPGHLFVLVTTAMKDAREWHQNEVLKVDFRRSIALPDGSGQGSIIFLKKPAKYRHVANSSYQAEVGLLSRWIKISGSVDSEPTDEDPLTCSGGWNWGDTSKQCPNKELTGFGGHIIIHNGGKGYVEGVELYRMGQTNVLGRYPIHFHDLSEDCADCYFKHSSVRRSFYRCISIHGTNHVTVTENVAYDITGYCYYLEDGVEEYNVFSFNLVAHVHYLGEAATGGGQTTDLNFESEDLTLPADVTASGFYITNVNNYIIGNAASGGWAGFAFPSLESPIGIHKNVNMRPSSKTGLTIDGNTAHSTGWWWYHASGFYFGGALYLDNNDKLVYNAGRDQSKGFRSPCNKDHCSDGDCDRYCMQEDQAWIQMTNSKAFLVPSVGLNSWSGRMEIIGFEAHDCGLSIEALESGFWIDQLLAVCRTGEEFVLPSGANPTTMKGDGFFWYDTAQDHIISNSTFRQCGWRSNTYNQYDISPTRGCDSSSWNGCTPKSTVWGFLAHSDEFNPESMQATKQIRYENCGRRFKLHNFRGDNEASTVSGRLQNWLDTDGTASGLNEPTIIGSGEDDAGLWWAVDDNVISDHQGPLKFIQQNAGPRRNIGHIRIRFDDTEHNAIGGSKCGNGSGVPCPALGYIKHWGPLFDHDSGLPVTAQSDISGPTGGFGWLLKLNSGAPVELTISQIEVHPDSELLLSIAYPPETSVNIVANAAYCSENAQYSCKEEFHSVASPELVRSSSGNAYHMTSNGLMTVRIIMSPQAFTGNKDWLFADMSTEGKWGNWYAIDRFTRADVTLLKFAYGPYITITADCVVDPSNAAYCKTAPTSDLPSVCLDSSYQQVSYDKCCEISDPDCTTPPLHDDDDDDDDDDDENGNGTSPAPSPAPESGTFKRIASKHDTLNGYLNRDAYYDPDTDSWMPSTDLYLATLDTSSDSWSSMHWKLVEADYGMYRIVCGWDEDSGYLNRDGVYDEASDSWVPGSTISVHSFRENWYSQRWVIEYVDDVWFYLIVQWGEDWGYLTRNNGSSVYFNSKKANPRKQLWRFFDI